MKPGSLRLKLTAWYTLALLVVLSLGAVIVLREQRRIGIRRVDRELDALISTLASVVGDELREMPNARAAAQEARNTVATPGRAVAILDTDGQPLAAAWEGLDIRGALPAADGAVHVWTADSPGNSWRVHTSTRSFDQQSFVLLVAAPLSDVEREQQGILDAILVAVPLMLVVAAAGGFYLASVGLRPITEALRLQRQFMADASHELRTPVSVARAAADVALSRAHRDEPEYREALTIVGAQARRLGRLVEDMLVLARADAGGYQLRPVDLYFDELVADCRRAVDLLATERGVTIRLAGATDVACRGDEDLLRRLVLNVLQNAVQHSPPGGAVVVDLDHEAGRVRLRVTDTGPGIEAADRERIFDRFVQLDSSRRAQGTGLGLPIARWIAEAHRGALFLERSGPGGSTFCVVLPATSPA
jgi:signal transduction histidine kinase